MMNLAIVQLLIAKINPTRKDRVKALNQCGITIYTDLVLEVLARHKNDWKIAMFFFVWASQQPGYSNGTETSILDGFWCIYFKDLFDFCFD
jgi:hypothetical protein